MSLITTVLTAVPYTNRPPVQDIIAKLHSYLTCNLLIGLSLILSYKQFGGKPIECMTPPDFTSSWSQYAEQYCLSSATYFVPLFDPVEKLSKEAKQESHINYYIWIPFFLLFQAACFKLPAIVWKYFHGQSGCEDYRMYLGMRVGEILRLAISESNTDPHIRNSNVNALCHNLQKVLKFHHRLKLKKITPHKVFRILNFKYSTYYVATVYILSKFLFLVNVVFQFQLLNRFLLPKRSILNGASLSNFFAFDIWNNIFTGNRTWKESGIFPRSTLCDFSVNRVGQPVNHTVQCVLSINLFTEKAFILLWGWYLFLVAITFINLFNWIISLANPIMPERFIHSHLEMSGHELFIPERTHPDLHQQLRKFIDKYLKTDGLFILWLIAQHSDIVFTTQLIYAIWETHYKIEQQRQALKSTDEKWAAQLNRFNEYRKMSQLEPLVSPRKATSDNSRVHSRVSINSPTHGIIPTAPNLKRTPSAETLPSDNKFNSDSDDYYDTFTIKHYDR